MVAFASGLSVNDAGRRGKVPREGPTTHITSVAMLIPDYRDDHIMGRAAKTGTDPDQPTLNSQVIEEARDKLRPAFEEVDRRTKNNLKRILDTFRQHQVCDSYCRLPLFGRVAIRRACFFVLGEGRFFDVTIVCLRHVALNPFRCLLTWCMIRSAITSSMV
jgi:hypothetical protein